MLFHGHRLASRLHERTQGEAADTNAGLLEKGPPVLAKQIVGVRVIHAQRMARKSGDVESLPLRETVLPPNATAAKLSYSQNI